MSLEFSVVIPCYRATDIIHVQLDALSKQKDAPLFEVILSDNGKNENLANVVKPYSRSLDIRIVDATDAPGASHARNQGVKCAQGKFILFCDADDAVEEYWVFKMSQSLLKTEGSLIGGEIVYGSSNDSNVLSRWGIDINEQYQPSKELNIRPSDDKDIFMQVAPRVPGNNFACRKKDYQSIDGFDESFGAGYEDCDFSWRMSLSGITTYYNNASVDYRLRETSLEAFKQRRSWEFQRERLRSRYHHMNVSGSSLKHSLQAAPISLFRLLTQKNKLQEAGNLGAAIGSIMGIIKFRFLNSN